MAAKTSQQITGNAQLQEGSLGAPQDQPIPHASHHAANHTQPQAKLTTNQHAPLLTCPVTHNRKVFVITKCSDSDTRPPPHSVASGPLVARLQLHDCHQDPGLTDNNQPACLSPGNQPFTGWQQVQDERGRPPTPASTPAMPASHHAVTHTAQPQTKPTTNQHAPLLTCPVTHNGKVFVATKCPDSDTRPPLH